MRYVSILRGINVGGRRKILMKDLKFMYEKIGLKNVLTYIQSGNIAFDSSLSTEKLQNLIEQEIKDTFGFDVPVVLRSHNELLEITAHNPFLNKGLETDRFMVIFLKDIPEKYNVSKALEYDFSPDKFEIIDKHVYAFVASDFHKSKITISFFESKLKIKATARNWKTTLKLLEMTKG